MARGWQSKSVEQQQEERQQGTKGRKPSLPPDEQRRNRKREGIELSRKRLKHQLESATDERHRRIIEQAIAELDAQLSEFR